MGKLVKKIHAYASNYGRNEMRLAPGQTKICPRGHEMDRVELLELGKVKWTFYMCSECGTRKEWKYAGLRSKARTRDLDREEHLPVRRKDRKKLLSAGHKGSAGRKNTARRADKKGGCK